MGSRSAKNTTDGGIVHEPVPFFLIRDFKGVGDPIHVKRAGTVLLNPSNVMPVSIERLLLGIGMTKSRPPTLAQVKIHATIGATIVRANVEERTAILSISFRKDTEVILTFPNDIHPHGDGVGPMLVGWEIISCVVHAGKQCLTSIVKREGISVPSGHHIAGLQIGDIHVVETDQIRRFGPLNFIQRPVRNEAIADLRMHSARQGHRHQSSKPNRLGDFPN